VKANINPQTGSTAKTEVWHISQSTGCITDDWGLQPFSRFVASEKPSSLQHATRLALKCAIKQF